MPSPGGVTMTWTPSRARVLVVADQVQLYHLKLASGQLPVPPRRPHRWGGSSAEVLDRIAGDRWASRGFVCQGPRRCASGGAHGTDILTGVIPESFQRQVRSADLPEHLILAVVPRAPSWHNVRTERTSNNGFVYEVAGGEPL